MITSAEAKATIAIASFVLGFAVMMVISFSLPLFYEDRFQAVCEYQGGEVKHDVCVKDKRVIDIKIQSD